MRRRFEQVCRRQTLQLCVDRGREPRAPWIELSSAVVECCFPDAVADEEAQAALESDALEVLSGFHNLEDCQWLLAFRAGVVVGIVMLVPYHDSMFVSNLGVSFAHRRRGVGAMLMRSASAHAAARGLPALSGTVFGGRTDLVRYYARLGGTVQPDFAIAAAGAPATAARLRAPSGALTACAVALPPPLPYIT
jgi:ribosomal protein S18 acetylase RimI-like enzyme